MAKLHSWSGELEQLDQFREEKMDTKYNHQWDREFTQCSGLGINAFASDRERGLPRCCFNLIPLLAKLVFVFPMLSHHICKLPTVWAWQRHLLHQQVLALRAHHPTAAPFSCRAPVCPLLTLQRTECEIPDEGCIRTPWVTELLLLLLLLEVKDSWAQFPSFLGLYGPFDTLW